MALDCISLHLSPIPTCLTHSTSFNLTPILSRPTGLRPSGGWPRGPLSASGRIGCHSIVQIWAFCSQYSALLCFRRARQRRGACHCKLALPTRRCTMLRQNQNPACRPPALAHGVLLLRQGMAGFSTEDTAELGTSGRPSADQSHQGPALQVRPLLQLALPTLTWPLVCGSTVDASVRGVPSFILCRLGWRSCTSAGALPLNRLAVAVSPKRG
jgi:hypothetical protein